MNAVATQLEPGEMIKCFACNATRKIKSVKRGAFKTIIELECGHARAI